MTRWKAAATHLLLSIAIITTVAGIVVWLWYPAALVHAAGIDRLIGLIAAVDITVGPLLTLIIYKQGKKGLKFDLAVIAVVQLALLGYGLHALSLKRPVFLVGVVDRFELVTANQILDSDLAEAQPPYTRLGWTGPLLVGTQLPTDPQASSDLMFEEIEGRHVHLRPRFYSSFASVGPSLAKHGAPVSEILGNASAREADDIRDVLGSIPMDEAAVLPLATASGAISMLVDARTASPIGPVAIDFWKVTRRN